MTNAIANVAEKAVGSGASKPPVEGAGPHAALPPNVLVAHLQEGIEAVHIATGQQLLSLPTFGKGSLAGQDLPTWLGQCQLMHFQ